MQKLSITTALAFAASTALADAPNRTTQGFAEFVEASGCVLVDMGGYSNLAAANGGNCPASVVTAFNGTGSKIVAGADGILGTADDQRVADN